MSQNFTNESPAVRFHEALRIFDGAVAPKLSASLPPMYSDGEARRFAFLLTRRRPRRFRIRLPFSGETLAGLIKHYEATTYGRGGRADHLNLLKLYAAIEVRQ